MFADSLEICNMYFCPVTRSVMTMRIVSQYRFASCTLGEGSNSVSCSIHAPFSKWSTQPWCNTPFLVPSGDEERACANQHLRCCCVYQLGTIMVASDWKYVCGNIAWRSVKRYSNSDVACIALAHYFVFELDKSHAAWTWRNISLCIGDDLNG